VGVPVEPLVPPEEVEPPEVVLGLDEEPPPQPVSNMHAMLSMVSRILGIATDLTRTMSLVKSRRD
jgi:hypothetical protein